MNSVFLENLNFKKKVETDLKVRIGGGDCEGSLAESISRISLMLSGHSSYKSIKRMWGGAGLIL